MNLPVMARVRPVWEGRKSLRSLPATVPINERMRRGKGKTKKISGAWFNFLWALQNNERAERFIISPRSGFVNKERLTDKDAIVAEAVIMAFNEVQVIDQYGKFSRISSLNIRNSPPSIDTINFENTPFLIHQFTVIDQKLRQWLPAGGLFAYYPVLSDGPELWVETRYLDFDGEVPPLIKPTDELPQDTGRWLVVRKGEKYYQRAGADNKSGTFKAAEILDVLSEMELPKSGRWVEVLYGGRGVWVRR